jgi:hypothetical protein
MNHTAYYQWVTSLGVKNEARSPTDLVLGKLAMIVLVHLIHQE